MLKPTNSNNRKPQKTQNKHSEVSFIFSLARLPPIKFLRPAGLLPAVHSHWHQSKTSLHDCSAAKFPSFHSSSQPEFALSGLLLWCCIRQFWNNNLKTALKPAKGKTSSHYCAIAQIICCGLREIWRWAQKSPSLRPGVDWLPLTRSSTKAMPEQSSLLPFWTDHCFECKQDRHSLARAAVLYWFWTMEDWGWRAEISCLCLCVHLSIRELNLGMRDECWRGT